MNEITKKRLMFWGFFLLFVIGFWMVFIMPGQIAKKELKKATVLYETALKKKNELADQADKMQWFKPDYAQNIRQYAENANTDLGLVKKILAMARKANAKDKQRLSSEANQSLVITTAHLDNGIKEWIRLQQITKEVKAIFPTLDRLVSLLEKQQNVSAQRIQRISEDCLSKYTRTMSEKLSRAKTGIDEIKRQIENAETVFPSEDNLSGKGDPEKARSILGQCAKLGDISNELQIEVINELTFQEEALTKAESSVKTAEDKFQSASAYLEAIVKNTTLLPNKALKMAYVKKALASDALVQANVALSEKVEGDKRDLAKAYSLALGVSASSDEITKESDHQIQMQKIAMEQIRRTESEISSIHVIYKKAVKSRTILSAYHNQSAWLAVSNNLIISREKVNGAEQILRKTEDLFREQEFERSIGFIRSSDALLRQAIDLIQDLQERADKLEDYRQTWPTIKKQAKSTISNEEDYVTEYGSHSSSAVSDFNDAVEALDNACYFANDNDFEAAVKKAKEANELADGTGDRAKNAYDDDVEEEEERQRAANSDNDDDSPFNFGTGGGGNSYDSSGGNIFDGGGQSGGRSYDGDGQSGGRSNDGGGFD